MTKGFHQPIKGKGEKSTGSCIGFGGSEGGTSDPPMPNFGKVVFSGGSINGTTITKSGAVRVNMATAAGAYTYTDGTATQFPYAKGFIAGPDRSSHPARAPLPA